MRSLARPFLSSSSPLRQPTRWWSSGSQGRDRVAAQAISGLPREQASRKAIISRPVKNSMQSGTANVHGYKLTFSKQGNWVNPLMGWQSSSDPLGNISMNFESEAEAVEFCKDNGFNYVIEAERPYERQHRSYSDNFVYTGNPKIKPDDFW